ncbi:lysophospholipid acyltransferase family protein [Amphiplicatus metriothermophilus]|uniref:1-acyl-sn-glycerol-3-phosphate acyltransferase n=1 Tax=Amphiplicatus metriothermophilus TaxID=1519374 RepID=A0A239PKA4_9PROT|nr:lysophospholipid acyltransferase family protein [Amphiplicatus metriothermophilus]MBB5517913.1 1-acyl-sn-glycerol-3-phosphate acyltransferase [Amphiplicatus metriothermophilus]SNT67753.1 1-acyl-sn-glycerol-3-phosphate acyltransferase [Amphiplicatus metriothermophilus]
MARLRSAVFLVYLVAGTLVTAVVAAPALLFGEKAAREAVRAWARLMLGGLRLICGIGWRVEGREHVPGGGAIVASNHQSMWETLALFALLPTPAAIFKKELLRIPIYGWWGLRAGSIAVDRKGGAKTMRAMTRAAAAKIAEGAQLIVFPEGTRRPVGARGPLQPGIAGVYLAANAPCVPVVHDSGKYWRHPGWVKFPGVVTVRFLPPIEPGLDRKAFIRALESRFDEGLASLADAAEPDPGAIDAKGHAAA